MADKKNDYPLEKEEVQTQSDTERTRERLAFVPRSDIYETEEAISVVMDMPGVSSDHVDITLDNGVLTIHGEPADLNLAGYQSGYREYRDGDFERRFTLNNRIDFEKIEAGLKEGVLRVTLPKSDFAKKQKIQVKSA